MENGVRKEEGRKRGGRKDNNGIINILQICSLYISAENLNKE